ncbi:Pleckstrin y domain-containing family G member 1 [Merluccius polli]|uniref:Pleckstrin y domain-containing family G member 1 n=1 Tax=Merluccius polli TaxID=89951 RepID=A0AA47NMT8_MERPO|nr:Pleckstrin y domain-containing family G member 1 [Merluccius polli]
MERGKGRRREAETEGEKGEASTSQDTLLCWDQASDVMLESDCLSWGSEKTRLFTDHSRVECPSGGRKPERLKWTGQERRRLPVTNRQPVTHLSPPSVGGTPTGPAWGTAHAYVEYDYNYPPDALPPLPEIHQVSGVALSYPASRHVPLRYCSAHSMDSSPDSAERPISYSSTSSSASSRDSHCSLIGRTLVPGPCPPTPVDLDTGAIRLELVPARQLGRGDMEGDEEQAYRGTGEVNGGGGGKSSSSSGVTGRRDSRGGQTSTGHSEPDLSPDVVEQTGPGQGPRTYVDRVVQEILDTERTYVQDLRSIVQDYLECISNQSRLALSAEDKGSLFGNIRDIYHFNRDLLHDLEKCNADPVAIAECFVAKSEEFHIYTQYCTNYPRSVAVLTECMRNKVLAKFFRERQESLRHSLPLGSYLLKPVQRILKYHLLLHEIANHMEKDTETYEVVQEAIDTMQRVAWHINDMKRKHEHAVRLQEIQSLLTNWKGPDLIGYGELVLEGTFRLQRAKNERTLFLFDKLLLVTKKREETYTYKAHILCCNLMLVEVIPKEPLSFSVFHYKNPKLQHTVQAKSQQDKRMWILHLKRLILENHPAKIPAKAKQAILEMDAMHHPGFHYSPDGEKKATPPTKEGPTPRRARRKEPLSKLLKNAKQSGANTEDQKRTSLGATLLSPVSQLALGTIGRSRSLINQSQESLDPCDHYEHSDREEGEEPHQQDADDEDDSGLGGAKRLRVPGKSSRKRLNPQASVDSIDQWKTFNMSPSDLQRARECLVREGSHHPPLLRTPNVMEEPPESPVPTLMVPGDGHPVRNIWADHRARRAMFPTRQRTVQPDDDEDIYQMFMPTEASGPEPETPPAEGSEGPSLPGSTRPCSWHVEQVPAVQVDPPPGGAGRVLRRASSAGEKASEPRQAGEHGTQPDHCDLEEIHTESSSNNISGSSSAEQLTVDNIENVYDNISYEDLKSMGLVRRDEEGRRSRKDLSIETWASNSQVATGTLAPSGTLAATVGIIPSTPGSIPSTPGSIPSTRGSIPITPGSIPSTPGSIPSTPGSIPSTPGSIPSTPGAIPSTPGAIPSTPGAIPNTPGTIPSTPGTIPSTPGTIPSTPGTIPSTPGTHNAPVVVASSPGATESLTEPGRPSESTGSTSQQGKPCELKIVEEENIYDTICFREPPRSERLGSGEGNTPQQQEGNSLLASEPELSESLGGFVSEESLHFGEDEGLGASGTIACYLEPDYSSSSASETFSQRSRTGDKMSEKVDEIWNDLENYIKVNEKKADRLPAAFPVGSGEAHKRPSSARSSPTKTASVSGIVTHSGANAKSPPAHHPDPPTPSFTIPIINVPEPFCEELSEEQAEVEERRALPGPMPAQPATPEPAPGTVKSIRTRLARLSSGSFRLEDDDLVELPQRPASRESQLKDLHSLFPGELAGLSSPLASSPSLLLGESVDFPLELMDKTKNRVFLMARQYSQKIKKANQLLRMRSMDPGDACGRSRDEKRQKDLADILEEKKQGGAAIGARIAEYSHLYDQVMFPPGTGGQASPVRHPGLPSSPSMPERSLEDDWLHSTYSNGELASFVSWPNEMAEARASSSPQLRLTPACSVPALKTLPTSPAPAGLQRWSSCMSAPSEKEEEHVYSTIKRPPPSSDAKTPEHNRCRSTGSLGDQGHERRNPLESGRAAPARHAENYTRPSLGRAGRQSSLPEQCELRRSALTLQDSQQVVVLHRESALGILAATQNYLTNFKDNGDDDDDYVEIRSEDESEGERAGGGQVQRGAGVCRSVEQNRGPVQSQSLPCTPVRYCHPLGSVEREHLGRYLWSEPQETQPTIGQSLREKFQCLSSSSFA